MRSVTNSELKAADAGDLPGEHFPSGIKRQVAASRDHEHCRARLAEDAGRYSHLRIEAKRKALDGLATGRRKGVESGDAGRGYDTIDDTNQSQRAVQIPPGGPFLPL